MDNHTFHVKQPEQTTTPSRHRPRLDSTKPFHCPGLHSTWCSWMTSTRTTVSAGHLPYRSSTHRQPVEPNPCWPVRGVLVTDINHLGTLYGDYHSVFGSRVALEAVRLGRTGGFRAPRSEGVAGRGVSKGLRGRLGTHSLRMAITLAKDTAEKGRKAINSRFCVIEAVSSGSGEQRRAAHLSRLDGETQQSADRKEQRRDHEMLVIVAHR